MVRRMLVAAAAGMAVATAVVVAGAGGPGAGAAVTRAVGFRATVLGWTSWYGSYDMGPLGPAFCVDHGIAAPDPDLRYVPTTLPVEADVAAALAWLYGANGAAARHDRVTAAAVMLAGHDLVGARYPHGPLRLSAMTVRNLAGFAGHEAEVLARARRLRADALAHAPLRGPLRLELGDEDGAVVARLADAGGRPVAGVAVEARRGLTPSRLVTGADGAARFQRTGGAVEVGAVVPDPSLHAHRPTVRAAQRVAVPTTVRLEATLDDRPGRLRVSKTGVPGLPVAGAVFEARPTAGGGDPVRLETGADGEAGPVPVAAGTWEVTEVRAPPGYLPAGPWRVAVEPGHEATVEVAEPVKPRKVDVHKVDALTGAALAGARLEVRRQPGGELVRILVSASAPRRVELAPGRYRLLEVQAPPGYARAAPLPFTVEPLADDDPPALVVRMEDLPLVPVRVRKRPVGPPGTERLPLAGAVFAARSGSAGGAETGRCTTDAAGECAFDEPVPAGTTVCVVEQQAPPGFAVADPVCAKAEAPSTTVEVDEPSLLTEVTATKRDPSGRPLAGAAYDLVRRDDQAERGDEVVARATSGSDGRLSFGHHLPGARYCAVERQAPPGHAAAGPVCLAHPLEAGRPAHLDLVDQPLTPPTTPPPPPTTPPTTMPPPATTAPPPPGAPPPEASAEPGLPRTGGGNGRLAATGVGLVLVGAGLVLAGRRPGTQRGLS